MIQKTRKRIVKNRLRELIQAKELKTNRRVKQHEIAEFAGVSDHTIISWMRNEVTRFDAKVIERICDYFNCDIGDLLYFEESLVDIREDPDQMED